MPKFGFFKGFKGAAKGSAKGVATIAKAGAKVSKVAKTAKKVKVPAGAKKLVALAKKAQSGGKVTPGEALKAAGGIRGAFKLAKAVAKSEMKNRVKGKGLSTMKGMNKLF